MKALSFYHMTVDICTENVDPHYNQLKQYDPRHTAVMETPGLDHAKMEGAITGDGALVRNAVMNAPKAVRDLGVIS